MTTPDNRRSNISTAFNRAHEAAREAQRAAVIHAAECGRLLNEAKETVKHGAWGQWVTDNCRFSPRTAQLYMRLADYLKNADAAKAQRVADMSLRAVQTLLKSRDRDDRAEKQADLLHSHWLLAAPLERRAFVTLIAMRGDVTAREARDLLGMLRTLDGPEDRTKNRGLEKLGIDSRGAVDLLTEKRVRLALSNEEVRELFDLAGEPATTLACVMATKTSIVKLPSRNRPIIS